jgi:hypothetical protein
MSLKRRGRTGKVAKLQVAKKSFHRGFGKGTSSTRADLA